MSDQLHPGNYAFDQRFEVAHPDADQLNAFAERALPEHERLQMLAHLASCSDCREIVALSLPPLEDSSIAEPAPLSKPRFADWFADWFAGWRLVWIATPALAALVLLTFYLKRPHAPHERSSSSTQMAAAHPPSAPAPEEPLPTAPTSKPRVTLRAAPSTRALNALDHHPTEPGQSTGGPTLAHGTMSGMAAGMGASPTSSGAANEAAAIQLSQPPPSIQAPAAVPSPAPVIAAKIAAPVVAAAQNSALPVSGIEASRSTAAFVLRDTAPAAGQAALPSGLAVLSLAANVHQRLAIDTRNQLFFSGDDGQHWKAVTPPWKSHAVKVANAASGPARTTSLNLAVPDHFSVGAVASAGPVEGASSLSGAVTDATGAVIAGATVVVTDNHTALIRTVKSDASGRYLVKELPPGVYRIEANAPGFLKQTQTAALAPSQQAVANIVLDVGASTATVTVAAASAQLEPLARPLPERSTRAKKPKVGPSATNVSPLFIVTTDTGDRWTSVNGQIWQHE